MNEMNGYEKLWALFWVLTFLTIVLITVAVFIHDSETSDTNKCIDSCNSPSWYDDDSGYLSCLDICMQNRTCGSSS